ncbi:MAG: glyoxalase [Amycolatopsis sp.]|jgi:catechol 2,3-dioxygenase-like lactoylglutathione lyase family enzyme|uniref:VOC family protein n=1 Tax=Amycolatopsis sp. TaxID=37632 RepID=UPI002625CACD|nr:VOC family protein [Amycolatopsis sp.]MCU1681175.1 glyoxalase [Amycolatopsis sp.]
MDVLSSRILLNPRDPEAAVVFYRDLLGLAVDKEFPGGTVFFLGNGSLEIVGKGETGPSPDVALWVQVRDLPGELEVLAAKGVTPVRGAEREPWGLDEAWISDPDGTRIVLVQIPEDHPLRKDPRA